MPEAAGDRQSQSGETAHRTLVHIPIVHGLAEMGSYQEELRHAYIRQVGEQAWQDSQRAIAAFWQALEDRLLSLDLDWSRLRLYQDALPVCGHEAEIVRDLAATGAANYRILMALMQRGARLEGTESAELLLRERELLMAGANDAPDRGEEAAALLHARDRFIAERIDATLQPGETGLLFIGALHHVAKRLPETIRVMELEAFAACPPRA